MTEVFKKRYIKARKCAAEDICAEQGWPLNFFSLSRENLKYIWNDRRWKFPKVYDEVKIKWDIVCGAIEDPVGNLQLFEIEKDINLELSLDPRLKKLKDPKISLSIKSDYKLYIVFSDSTISTFLNIGSYEVSTILDVYEEKIKEIMNLNFEKIYA